MHVVSGQVRAQSAAGEGIGFELARILDGVGLLVAERAAASR